jgi:hypothetical protein
MPPMMNGIRTVVRLFWVGSYHCLPHPGIDFESQTDIQSDCLQSNNNPTHPPLWCGRQTCATDSPILGFLAVLAPWW